MTKWARLIDGEAVDVVEIDPSTLFVAEIAEEFIQVPNATVPGSRKSGQQWTHPDPVAPSPLSPPPRRMSVTPIEFMMMFTFAEEAAIRTFASSNDPNAPTVAAMLRHLDDQRLQFSQRVFSLRLHPSGRLFGLLMVKRHVCSFPSWIGKGLLHRLVSASSIARQ